MDFLPILYDAKYHPSVFSDVSIEFTPCVESNDYSNDCDYIIINTKIFKNSNEKERRETVNQINKSKPTNIFIMDTRQKAENLQARILSIISNSSNFFNCAIETLIFFFFIFMKITLVKTSIKKIKNMKSNTINHSLLGSFQKQDNKVLYDPSLCLLNAGNFFNFCIFHITYALIIPALLPNFLDFDILTYVGFRSNLFLSVIYYRSYFGQKDFKSNLDILGLDTKRRKGFILNSMPNLDNYEPPKLNQYMINLFFLCTAVWVSQYFNVFETKQTTSSEMELKKQSKVKKIMKIIVITMLFMIWAAFLGYGIAYFMDYVYLFHGELFYNFMKVSDPKITVYLLLIYYHGYFYILMIGYTYQVYYRNKKFQLNQQNVRTSLDSNPDNSILGLQLVPNTDLSDLIIQ